MASRYRLSDIPLLRQPAPILTPEQAMALPGSLRRWLQALDVLIEEAANHYLCPDCSEPHAIDWDEEGPLSDCPHALPALLPQELAHDWRVSWGQLCDHLRECNALIGLSDLPGCFNTLPVGVSVGGALVWLIQARGPSRFLEAVGLIRANHVGKPLWLILLDSLPLDEPTRLRLSGEGVTLCWLADLVQSDGMLSDLPAEEEPEDYKLILEVSAYRLKVHGRVVALLPVHTHLAHVIMSGKGEFVAKDVVENYMDERAKEPDDEATLNTKSDKFYRETKDLIRELNDTIRKTFNNRQIRVFGTFNQKNKGWAVSPEYLPLKITG